MNRSAALYLGLTLPLMVGAVAYGDELVPPAVGEWAVTRVNPAVSGCPTEAELYRFVELFRVDKPAADAFARQHCIQLGLGTEVMIERDNTAWSKMMCVRPRGDPQCRWVPTSAVESKADAYGKTSAEGSAESSAVKPAGKSERDLTDASDCILAGGHIGVDRHGEWGPCVKK
jgi:hypothetical protein